MRKVILYIATSLDGYIAEEDGGIRWLTDDVQFDEGDTSYDDFYSTVDTVVLGRTTYDQVTQELSPANYPYEDVKSYVMTSKPFKGQDNLIPTNENIINLIKTLKAQSGKAIWIVGGASIIYPLVKENLIDEYQISIVPVLLGKGIPLFEKNNQKINLKIDQVIPSTNFTTIVYKKADSTK